MNGLQHFWGPPGETREPQYGIADPRPKFPGCFGGGGTHHPPLRPPLPPLPRAPPPLPRRCTPRARRRELPGTKQSSEGQQGAHRGIGFGAALPSAVAKAGGTRG